MNARSLSLPAFDSGALAALKWIALALMTVDHVDAFFYGRELGTWVGRLVFPVFGFVIAYNLARPSVDAAARSRVLRRLVLFAVLSFPFHAALASVVGGWWPLNIMVTFAVAVVVVDALERRDWLLAGGVFLLGGALVEYWWPGLLWILSVWWAYRSGHVVAGYLACAALAGLSIVNGSHWALLALPLLAVASTWTPRLPRLRWAFYAYYPAHLAVMLLAGAPGV